ncbi:MAG: alpha/beta fold hydrolase [Gammaproteobacteria bacterium]
MTIAPESYDEFSMFQDNCTEAGIPWRGPPRVERRFFDVGAGQRVSALVWGEGPAEMVFMHGGGQNAHTWDTVILGLGRPAIAFDLPGHGHSDWRADRDYWPWRNADAIAAALDALGARPRCTIGMSLGGLTNIRLAAIRPDLAPRAAVVDVTPNVMQHQIRMTLAERGTTALVAGPKVYPSFEAMYEETLKLSPLRTPAGVRRGVLHNARRLEDGRWRWRYDIGGAPDSAGADNDFTRLWPDVDRIACPMMLVVGGESKFVLPEHRAEFERRRPGLRVEVVPGAGHAVQSDQPLRLVELLRDFAGLGV